MKLGIIAAVLAAAPWFGSPRANEVQRSHASYNGLTLVLVTRVSGATVTARAKLTNRGASALEYYGGCAPPVLQIQANDAVGRHVHGWLPPRVRCGALSVLYLAPGASIIRTAHFRAPGIVNVRAVVQVRVTPSHLFQTPPLKLRPAH